MATRPPKNKTGGTKGPSNRPPAKPNTGGILGPPNKPVAPPPRTSRGLGQLPASWVQDPVTGKWRNTLTDEQQRQNGNNVPPAAPPADTTPPLPDYGNNLTPDEASIQENKGYDKTRDDILGGIAAQRIATGEQYGVDVNTGLISDNVDITNPYSRAAMMNRSYATNKASNMNSYANRGLLTSGAYARRLASAAQTNNQNRAGLEQDWTTASLGWQGQENQANADLARARVAANRSLIERRMATDAAVFERKDAPKDPTPPPPDYTSFLNAIATKLKPTPKSSKKPSSKKPSGKKGGKK